MSYTGRTDTLPVIQTRSNSLGRELGLTLGALGVVFGDIGTSPLYAMSQSAVAATR